MPDRNVKKRKSPSVRPEGPERNRFFYARQKCERKRKSPSVRPEGPERNRFFYARQKCERKRKSPSVRPRGPERNRFFYARQKCERKRKSPSAMPEEPERKAVSQPRSPFGSGKPQRPKKFPSLPCPTAFRQNKGCGPWRPLWRCKPKGCWR